MGRRAWHEEKVKGEALPLEEIRMTRLAIILVASAFAALAAVACGGDSTGGGNCPGPDGGTTTCPPATHSPAGAGGW
jgi:hypothetical protein